MQVFIGDDQIIGSSPVNQGEKLKKKKKSQLVNQKYMATMANKNDELSKQKFHNLGADPTVLERFLRRAWDMLLFLFLLFGLVWFGGIERSFSTSLKRTSI